MAFGHGPSRIRSSRGSIYIKKRRRSSSHLKTAIEQACSDLIWINEAVAKIGSAGTLSRESNEFFNMSPQLAVQLEHAKGLLPVRDAALTALLAFPKQLSIASAGLHRN